MSAPRAARGALKKATKTPARAAASAPKPASRFPIADSTGPPILPNRANPHLKNPPVLPTASETTTMSPRVMTILGVSALTVSTYIGYLYASYSREVKQSQSLSVPHDVSDRYNHTAGSFDADIEMSEKLMRMGSKRAALIHRAHGNVLEVSCGTGRNIPYYELRERRGINAQGRMVQGCRSVTFVDLSPEMVEITRGKFEKQFPDEKVRVEFRVQDAAEVPRPGFSVEGRKQEGYYDTVVQTMGLCSMPDPVKTLKHLGTVVEPLKGEILLLEHGRSHYDWVNRVLDNLAPAHADRHGCWWNRDIGQIVRESGLEVVEEKRWHFGTTWKYVLRPARTGVELEKS
ncbi:ubiquinone/menaquinone biosynthesis-related protein [Aspergillus heteromorphus CBS 117.55]|uniref:Ubiquinone/menaquinone biosynthesis-related protein n=1 Tax=Aspergillus heteromorphus CBS 117.55 TaxID=1448321 RepID=A0A317X7N3_9EURO|nr:ubiquinone/menaquinone biosynthesis-related protein [Aspergillus heteromorphus CBS 117.55]PWY92610.1 ubiquinone/menaquinone biosynthesis-related protein [Aspergillus heteromorphus CBS 117.55]